MDNKFQWFEFLAALMFLGLFLAGLLLWAAFFG
jgi:hypothetical protein